MRDPSRGAALWDVARREQLHLTVHRLDVDDPASVDSAVTSMTKEVGPVTVVVNNAGIQMKGALEDFDDDEVLGTLQTNLLGPIRLIRAVLPAMRANHRGVIVNVTSVSGYTGLPGEAVYAASKHALEGLSESLWHELLPYGIRVHVVEPGGFPTELDRTGSSRRSGHSPYSADLTAFFAAIRSYDRGDIGRDPALVARVVADAVVGPAPFRQRVGDDAEAIARLYRSVSFEEFAATLTTTIAWRENTSVRDA